MKSNLFQWRSLKTRVTLFTLAIFLIGIWSLTFYASRMLREDMQGLLGDQQFATVSLLAHQVNHELDDRLRLLEVVAGGVTPIMLGKPAALQALLQQNSHLQMLFNGGVIALGLDGTAIAEVPLTAGRIGVNYMDVYAVATALKAGKSTIGRPVMGRKLLAPVFGMAVPIRDPQGKVMGILMGVINLGKPNFLDKITESRYGKTGGYFLAAPQLRLNITATDKSRIMQPLPAPGISPAIDRFVQGYEGTDLYVNQVGVEVLVSAKNIPVSGWKLVANLPTAEAFAPIYSMQRRMLLATILLTLLAGSLIWWMTWWMLRRQLSPMLAATRTLATLSGTSQPLKPLPITSQDEIGELISGFNRLLETLAQRETLLKQILDTSSVAIFLVDKEGRITQANQRMAEMFGCSVEALVGSEYVALVPPAEREMSRQRMQALLSSEIQSVDLERLYWRADRTEFWGNLTGKRFTDASGEDRGLVGVIADITERKCIEVVLRNSEARYRNFVAELPLGIAITQDGLIKYVNRALVEMIGYPENEILGQPFIPLVDEADRPRLRDLHQRRMNGEEVEKSYVVGMVRKDGEVRQWQGYVNTIDWEGKPSGLGSFIDITERRLIEEQVRQLAFHDALTQLPNRRLLNDRLIQAMAASKRSACYGALMFLDLNNFKSLNDQHGHEVGDLLLIEAADRLKSCVREIDTVARFGGDEFVVMLGELDIDRVESTSQARVVAEKIRLTLSEPYLLTIRRDGKAATSVEYHCSASIGVALFVNHEASPDDVLKWADTAMYQAKATGLNLIRFYDQNI
ncbi:MAG: PAS domain S-box protein [Rhodoferax sp.]|uniref:PAS domain S-box protein n=1 Tax=Rhodoferax sp. TaxID=50421 RepID=UPI002735761B|nr:PAS domain S-box protein [Rhodoferax sp.]MDP3866170.1 PAS domain S-box protein [Rhodoferax sp.]